MYKSYDAVIAAAVGGQQSLKLTFAPLSFRANTHSYRINVILD